MNYRSISFRLVAFYSIAVAFTLAVFCVLAYLGLYRYLRADLAGRLSEQANQIAVTWLHQIDVSGADYVIGEIDGHVSPQITNHFVRITQSDGTLLYDAKPPHDGSFDPGLVPPLRNVGQHGVRDEYAGGKQLLIYSMPVSADDGGTYMLEVGEALEHIRGTVHEVAVILLVILPLALSLITGGGYLLVKRTLEPVDVLTRAAEHISSRNLAERLPIPHTGDEIARLSVTLNKMIERLEESFNRIAQFTADASHELRTPLTILRGEIEVALRRKEIGPGHRDVLESLLEEADRLSKTVESLLTLSRLDSGEFKLALIQFDVGKLCKETVEQMQLLADDKSISIECSCSGDVIIQADVIRIRQILINIIDNAIKYTPFGGRIEVRGYYETNCAVVQVSDTGCGIPSDAVPFVFNRFFRADDARARHTGGVGLGLSIAKSICDLHGGRITVDSAVGVGTTVKVCFPHGWKTARVSK